MKHSIILYSMHVLAIKITFYIQTVATFICMYIVYSVYKCSIPGSVGYYIPCSLSLQFTLGSFGVLWVHMA